ncbi:MAG: hypothetical protein P4L41_09400 [Flavipsychrobacter sp.]|nr:hypothetical protein [Flavipsychrobacter sp.]
MEHVTLTQEILKWFGVLCLTMMAAVVTYGWLRGLAFERNLKIKRR